LPGETGEPTKTLFRLPPIESGSPREDDFPRVDESVVQASLSTVQSPTNGAAEIAPVKPVNKSSLPLEQTRSSPALLHVGESFRSAAAVPVVVPAAAEEVTPKLNLERAIDLALRQNPDLVAKRQAGLVSRAMLDVARTYPFNPQFQAQVLPSVRDRDGNDGAVDQQYVVMQTFELAHQQRFREAGASADLYRVRWGIAQFELLTVVQAERLFFTAIYLRELRDQAKSVADLNEQLRGIVQRRFDAGQANQADLVLTIAQSRTTRRQADLAEANYQTALLNLGNQLNIASPLTLEPVGTLRDWQWRSLDKVQRTVSAHAGDRSAGETSLPAPPLGSLADEALSQLVARRPDMMVARRAVGVARANLALARAARTPNLQLGPMYQRDDASTTFWGFQGQVNIPVVNSGATLVRQRMAELRQQQTVLEQLREKSRREVRSAVARYERARRLVESFRSRPGRPLPDALAAVDDQFRAGRIDILRVFAVRTSLIQSRQVELDMLNEVAQAAAGVTAVTGLPISALFADQPAMRTP